MLLWPPQRRRRRWRAAPVPETTCHSPAPCTTARAGRWRSGGAGRLDVITKCCDAMYARHMEVYACSTCSQSFTVAIMKQKSRRLPHAVLCLLAPSAAASSSTGAPQLSTSTAATALARFTRLKRRSRLHRPQRRRGAAGGAVQPRRRRQHGTAMPTQASRRSSGSAPASLPCAASRPISFVVVYASKRPARLVSAHSIDDCAAPSASRRAASTRRSSGSASTRHARQPARGVQRRLVRLCADSDVTATQTSVFCSAWAPRLRSTAASCVWDVSASSEAAPRAAAQPATTAHHSSAESNNTIGAHERQTRQRAERPQRFSNRIRLRTLPAKTPRRVRPRSAASTAASATSGRLFRVADGSAEAAPARALSSRPRPW